VGEIGRTSESSYPWKWKLTEGLERCSNILPVQTLDQLPCACQRWGPGSGAGGDSPQSPGAGVEARLSAGQTQRQIAAELGVARSTLQGWSRATAARAVPATLAAFVTTPEGVHWLHRVVLAAPFAITRRGGAEVRVVCECLELRGLSAFVGASYGSQQALHAALEAGVVAVAEEPRTALAAGMAPRQVTVREDETFHPEICLVALEPVSNFILLERYAEDRSAATWTQALEAAMAGLSVEVIQGTSDEAKALRRHVATDLDAHHSPDLCHGQHEVAKATSLHLAR
jgi:hypothetical protein